MSPSKPFTIRERRRMSDGYGRRPVNNWGSGDLPAPWCPGDVVRFEPTRENCRVDGGEGFYVVVSAFSIDEGDAWYFRVARTEFDCSDRLHAAVAGRSNWTSDVDWMADFHLIETADPDGLAERERMLADGWTFTPPPTCPTCGQRTGAPS